MDNDVEMEIQSNLMIFEDIMEIVNERSFKINLLKDCFVVFTLPSQYPLSASPQYFISGPSVSIEFKESIKKKLNDICKEYFGSQAVYECINIIQSAIPALETESSVEDKMSTEEHVQPYENSIIPSIISSDTLTDRKSVFQGHVARVKNMEEVNMVLWKLKQVKKIANATHNMYAYRFSLQNYVSHDCDDDGESGAGAKMAQVLHLMKAEDLIVVVSRWYGGIQLGPDRFRHINNITRDCVNNIMMD
uniref:RWD domain-containing protein n=1 Tax=Rhabditophanes sp. KR3021 TaxID=114890 RepID=A0AC35TN98_9BILA